MLAQNGCFADKLSRSQLISALGLDKPMWVYATGSAAFCARRFQPRCGRARRWPSCCWRACRHLPGSA